MKPYSTDKNSIIESYRLNCFDLETWFNTFDSVLGNIETNYAEFLKRLYSFNFSLRGGKPTKINTLIDIRLVELKEDWKESKWYFSGNGTTEHRSFVARNLKKYTLSEMLKHTQRAHISYFNKK